MKIFLLTVITVLFSSGSFSQSCPPNEQYSAIEQGCVCIEGYCRNNEGQCVPLANGECEAEAEVDYAETAIAGQCYTISTYPCSGGGFQTACTFTGVYGAPLSCTSVGCGPLGAWPKTRCCVRK